MLTLKKGISMNIKKLRRKDSYDRFTDHTVINAISKWKRLSPKKRKDFFQKSPID